ncbi:MAG: DUF86 domain-containing protein [Planctomycetes bacterium]|nr:DUF86 domain-containing protein [Planctomycetota bacterium]MCK5472734.1 DUF86 domain-containing protein [Planctomycetota bacterium]
MLRDETMYLQDIAQSCEKILKFTKGLTQQELVDDDKTYDAVVRNLEVIGEAAKHIPDNIREKLCDIQWRKIAGMRDMLAHAYFGIDNNILWDVVQNKIPPLFKSIKAFISENTA